MRIIYNRHFPFGTFLAINLFGIIFCRSDNGRMTSISKNHEYIHTLQQREMLFIFFMLWYVTEWIYHLIRLRNSKAAYHAISFEREAYANQHNLSYPKHRRHFSWVRYLGIKQKHR